MVLDLIAQVSARERQQWAGVEVGGTQHLAEIPVRFAFLLDRGRGELLRPVGEVHTENHQMRPQIARNISSHVRGHGPAPPRAAQRRKN
jgi:hypothetical protein